MTDKLDGELKELIDRWIVDLATQYDTTKQYIDYDTTPTPDEEWAILIGKIKQAFTEAGYVNVTDRGGER